MLGAEEGEKVTPRAKNLKTPTTEGGWASFGGGNYAAISLACYRETDSLVLRKSRLLPLGYRQRSGSGLV